MKVLSRTSSSGILRFVADHSTPHSPWVVHVDAYQSESNFLSLFCRTSTSTSTDFIYLRAETADWPLVVLKVLLLCGPAQRPWKHQTLLLGGRLKTAVGNYFHHLATSPSLPPSWRSTDGRDRQADSAVSRPSSGE
ncbi:hypothetical protein BIW11_05607 [Tropilaelaps mercedesae]|uniref:Uncharacterized protein n=1 Tax=Tropilaelaps mercedesae TaxID=418985 RepID=A0A1V9Y1K7_9ACAR|nr:hypothetical protein BIW11_05607 [Tropilaelaps mercedesae]